MSVEGVADLVSLVTSWVERREQTHLGLWLVHGDRKRRLCAPGLPSGFALASPPADPWKPLESLDEVDVPGRPDDRLHALRGADGELVGALLLAAGSRFTELAGPIGRVLARAARADRSLHRALLLDAVLDFVNDGVIAVNVDGDLLAYGAALASSTGWSAEDVRRHGWTNLVYSDPAVRAEVQRGIAALLRGWPSEGQVRTLARRDGSDVRMAIWSRVVADPSGGAPALLGILRDVTTDEEARRRSAREEGLTQLGRIAGRIAHEYNNLLCAVMGHAELIEATAGLPDVVNRRAGTIVRSARRGAHLSSRLLAFTGSSRARPVPVDIAEVVSQVRDLYGPRLPHGARLEVFTGELARAEVDPTQLQQALTNLVLNAAEAMSFGGEIVIRARMAMLPTDVRYLAPEAPPPGTEMVELSVTDQGPGFTPRALERLFEPFFTEKEDGHGMGLPAVRGMLAAHGGAADVRNGTPPTGATVTLWLPRSTRPELHLDEEPDDTPVVPGGVWIADDQEAVLEFSRVALVAAGATVETFPTVASVLAAAAATPADRRPELLVLDVQLGDGDGPSLLRDLRQLGFTARVVWSTGHTPESMKIPPGPVLRKPYTGADLVAAAQRALGRPDR